MCGIAGQIDYDQNLQTQAETLKQMQAVLRRRGPDQEGVFLADHAALAHTRLCVIDAERGRQPMTVCQGSRACTLVYNGELYNTEELRSALSRLGWTFSGHSDTEVLLKSYMEWGTDCVSRFNGIFALSLIHILEGKAEDKKRRRPPGAGKDPVPALRPGRQYRRTVGHEGMASQNTA